MSIDLDSIGTFTSCNRFFMFLVFVYPNSCLSALCHLGMMKISWADQSWSHINMAAFWLVAPCSLQRFRGPPALSASTWHSETLNFSTRLRAPFNPQDSHQGIHRLENIKSHYSCIKLHRHFCWSYYNLLVEEMVKFITKHLSLEPRGVNWFCE